MNTVSRIITCLSEDEKSDFLAFAKAKNKRHDVKNVQLFQLISKGIQEDLDQRLYGRKNKNALHALQKRLHDNLVEFLAVYHFSGEQRDEMGLLKSILTARVLLERGEIKVAWKLLDKAFVLAQELELYAIINEILYTKLQHVHLTNSEAVAIIELLENNQLHYSRELRLVAAYARIKEQINSTNDMYALIENELAAQQISSDKNLSYKAIHQLMHIMSQAAYGHANYEASFSFMRWAHDTLSYKEGIKHKHVYYHKECLFLMAETFFRNKYFVESQQIIEDLFILDNDIKIENRWITLQSLIFNFTNQNDLAIQIATNTKKPSPELSLVLSVFLFHARRFKEAAIAIRDIHHTDKWLQQHKGLAFVIKKNIVLLLIHIERKQLDLFHSRLRSFYKKYKKSLLDLGENRVITYIQFLQQYDKNPSEVTSPEFKQKVEVSFTWSGPQREDIFAMSFYAWLKARMERKDTYKVTLDLIAAARALITHQ